MENIDSLKNDCIGILNLMEIKDKLEHGHIRNMIIREKRYIEFKSDFPQRIRNLINYLLDFSPEIKENYSVDYIRSRLYDFFADLKFDSEPDRSKKIDEFSESPNGLFKQINTFVIPRIIEGLGVDSDIVIGKVSFVKYSNEMYEQIFRNYGYKGTFENTIVPPEYDSVKASIAIAEVKAGDNRKAIEKSEHLIEQSLNVLRLYNTDSQFGILGDIFSPTIFAMIYNIDNNNLQTSWSLRDKRTECLLDSEKIESLKEFGLDNIENILKKENPDRTDMENKLILAIRWFGETSMNYEVPENFSKLVIALETLLLKEEKVKKLNLAARIPFINYPEIDDGRWMKISEFIVKIYEERNNLMHEGHSNYTETQYYQLHRETQKCIINVAKDIHMLPNFSDWKFDEKCADRKKLIEEYIKKAK